MQDDVKSPILVHSRVDPERVLHLPAGRFTNGHPLVALVLGVAATVAVFGLAARAPGNVVSQSLTQRGPVPYAIVLFTCWALGILLIKAMKIRAQRKVLAYPITPDGQGFSLSPATVGGVIDEIYRIVDDPRRFVLSNRVMLALSNLRNMQRIGDVRDTLESQAEFDEALAESGYTFLRALIWAIPVLGFIGTVLGLSAAVGAFSSVLAAASEIDQIKPALREVTTGLAVAFETTLQGLLGAMGVHLLMTSVKRSEERFLDDCREYTQRQIVGRLRLFAGEADGA